MLVLHHDLTSPASALAVERLLRLREAHADAAVRLNGIDVLGIDAALPVTLDVLAELDEVADRAAELGVELRRPTSRPPTARAHAATDVAVAVDAGVEAAWLRALRRAYWVDDRDVADVDVLVDLASDVGAPPDAVRAVATDHERVAAVRRRTAALRGDGVGGVPVCESAGSLVPADLPEDDLLQLARLG